MNKFIMLCGLPATGKSHTVNNLDIDTSMSFIYSTDLYIEEMAKIEGKTYSEVFKKYIKEAEQNMDVGLVDALLKRKMIIWDRTCLSVKSRTKTLNRIPSDYLACAWAVIPPRTPQEELDWETRLKNREVEGKVIPPDVMKTMRKTYVLPTLEENFDVVSYADIYGEHVETFVSDH